jgi:hypothetical protein
VACHTVTHQAACACDSINVTIPCSQAARKQQIHGLISALEQQSPVKEPTQHLDRVAGSWRLLYTTINIKVSCVTYAISHV